MSGRKNQKTRSLIEQSALDLHTKYVLEITRVIALGSRTPAYVRILICYNVCSVEITNVIALGPRTPAYIRTLICYNVCSGITNVIALGSSTPAYVRTLICYNVCSGNHKCDCPWLTYSRICTYFNMLRVKYDRLCDMLYIQIQVWHIFKSEYVIIHITMKEHLSRFCHSVTNLKILVAEDLYSNTWICQHGKNAKMWNNVPVVYEIFSSCFMVSW